MTSSFQEADKQLTIQITEEIDHHTTEKLRRKMDYEITRFMPRKVMLDFSKVTFMDSAGIGLLIGRYKLAKLLGGTLEVNHASAAITKVLEMSGVVRIIPIHSVNSEMVG
ncbi:MAG: anti-sigma factor antagonist [Clostridia bacterium]|nr:anti-sigma factor antagonist [Clostridia bacterium]